MDPFSLTAGALQIAGACAQCTVTIIKICGDIKSVDARISSFCDEVGALRATYEGLEKSLSSPLLLEAARVASQTSDGFHLWKQIRDALDDSKKTMRRVNDILIQITKASGFARRIKAHLTENFHSGELSRLRQRIQFFNAALSLPIQMVCVMLQLEQRGMTTDHHNSLDLKLVSLEQNMRALVQRLSLPSRSPTLGGTTIAASDIMKLDEDDGMKTYIAFAKKFLTTASAAASTRSSLSTMSPAIEPDILDGHQHTVNDLPLPGDNRSHVEGWIQPPSAGMAPQSPQTGGHSRRSLGYPAGNIEDDNEVEYMRTKQHLKLGQETFEQSEHTKAERHFRRALALMQDHDFDGRISFQPSEVVLMLAECCLKQDKLDDAAALLEPVAAMRPDIFPRVSSDDKPSDRKRSTPGRGPDKLQALAASHMLGRVFVLKGDFDNAEKQGLRAFTERRKDLGPQDEKTLESVRLVIEIYKTRGEEGDEEEAEGYEVFLSTPEKQTPAVSTDKLLTTTEETPRSVPTLIAPGSPHHEYLTNVPRSSFVRRIRHLGRSSQYGIAQSPPSSDMQRLSMSRSTTCNDPQDPDVAALLGVRGVSSPSEASTHERALSMSGDDESIATPSTGRLSRSSSSRTLEPTFQAIADLCKEKRFDRAVKVAIQFLETYPSSYMVIRKPELKENIKHGYGHGLAKTGRGYSPLHFFCELREEHAEEVNLLIRQGVDVNAIAFKAGYTLSNPKDPFTALQQATERGFSTITSLLLAVEGVKTDVRDSEGYTPLMVACRKGHHSIVKQLLDFPLPTEFPPTWHGNTLLHDASRRCDPILVEMLLEHHTDIDGRDRFGKTALMHAVVKADIADPMEKRRRMKGRCKTVQMLLEAGADPTLKDHRANKTVRDYAVEEDDAELMMLLDQAPRTGISELVA
jgi:TolA-binding protein